MFVFVAPFSCGNMTVFLNTDIMGFDLAASGGATWSTCCTMCLNNIACRSFTLNIPASTCYLKTTPSNNGVYSATHMSAIY